MKPTSTAGNHLDQDENQDPFSDEDQGIDAELSTIQHRSPTPEQHGKPSSTPEKYVYELYELFCFVFFFVNSYS